MKMPLPPALAAKLAKRGILKENNIPITETEISNKDEEEVIAEDYDETPVEPLPIPKPPPLENFDKYQGWVSCPNKWNVYHECTPGCRNLWKESTEINSNYNRKRQRMIQKYPLPGHWKEILEPGIGRYYYWNTDTDMVSWLPPGHPKCQVSRAAAVLRKQMMIDREERLKEEKRKKEEDEDDSENEGSSEDDEDEEDDEKSEKQTRKRRNSVDSESSESSEESDEDEKDRRFRDRREKEATLFKDREKERSGKEKPRKSRKLDELDPMDPAAYSDCPRGTWASGLPQKDEAKTGVDFTVTGPLYQMRPYPNPGSVLRKNAEREVGPKKPQ